MLKPLNWYRKLSTKKGRLGNGAFLIEGDRAVNQIIGSRPDQIIEVVTIDDPPPIYLTYPTRILTESQFRSISLTKSPQGILAVVRLPLDTYSAKLPDDAGEKILLLEDIQDPGNVGTLIRTAAAFDFSGVLLTEKCADPFSPKCVQSTAGTVFSLWVRKSATCIEHTRKLKQSDFTLTVADVHGTDDPSLLRLQTRLVIALGNEASGPSEKLLQMADYQVKIPLAEGKAESLNVAACGAILMYLSSSKSK